MRISSIEFTTRHGVFVAILALLIAAAGCNSDKPTDPGPIPGPTGPRDTVTVSSDTVSAGDTAEVFLLLTNPDSAVASFAISILSDDSGILFDTAATLSPRFPSVGMVWQSARHDSVNVASIIALPSISGIQVPISTGSGAIMSFRYAVDSSVSPGTYMLDTTRIVLLPSTSPLQISYVSGTMMPAVHFAPGRIVVQ